MSVAIIYSRANVGIEAVSVTIEAHLSNGLPGFCIVGLPEKAVRESKDRVRSALLNAGFEFPSKRIIINLAPADLPKEGGRYDLPIALGILAASSQIASQGLSSYEFAGELALSGQLRPITGSLPFAIAATRDERTLILPAQNACEATLPTGTHVLIAEHLLDICAYLNGSKQLLSPERSEVRASLKHRDLLDVCAQENAKRALEIAAAGYHSLLMMGPPGTGKTMIASRMPGILPPLSEEEALMTASITSIYGQEIDLDGWLERPFRAPHHTASTMALVGGGSIPHPGEISLAHNGVLFLDELAEFNRYVLETLREPLESGKIAISRAAYKVEFPAKFQLIAAMNPCPCGQLGNPNAHCRCSPDQVIRYRSRISSPLLDRIDLHLEVPALPLEVLMQAEKKKGESSECVRKRVISAHAIQIERQKKLNAELSGEQLISVIELTTGAQQEMMQAVTEFKLSARAYHRILRVSRTIADLAKAGLVEPEHLLEALSYRQKLFKL